MRLSTAKDLVLEALVTGKISYEDLKIDKHTKAAALIELENELFLDTIGTSVSGSGRVLTYAPKSVHPKAAHFYYSGQRFRKIERKHNRKKNFNYFITTLTQLGLLAIAIYTTYQSVSEIKTYRKEMQQLRQLINTQSLKYNKEDSIVVQKRKDSLKK
jgi:hypothetical protein